MKADDQGAYRRAPLAPTTVTVGTGSTSAITLSPIDTFHMFQADGGKVYYHFGGTTGMSAATTDHWHLGSGGSEEFLVTEDRKYVRFISDSAGVKLRHGPTN